MPKVTLTTDLLAKNMAQAFGISEEWKRKLLSKIIASPPESLRITPRRNTLPFLSGTEQSSSYSGTAPTSYFFGTLSSHSLIYRPLLPIQLPLALSMLPFIRCSTSCCWLSTTSRSAYYDGLQKKTQSSITKLTDGQRYIWTEDIRAIKPPLASRSLSTPTQKKNSIT